MDVRVLGNITYYFFFGAISRIPCYNYNYGLCNQFYEKKVDNEEYRYEYKWNV
jgi:hypothetical protein